MKSLKFAYLAIPMFCLILSACGGGSDGGDSNGNGPVTPTPSVTMLEPANQSEKVSTNSSIKIQFAAPVKNVTPETVTLRTDAIDGAVVNLSTISSDGNNGYTLVPEKILKSSTRHFVVIDGVTDINGNALTSQHFYFTTDTGTGAGNDASDLPALIAQSGDVLLFGDDYNSAIAEFFAAHTCDALNASNCFYVPTTAPLPSSDPHTIANKCFPVTTPIDSAGNSVAANYVLRTNDSILSDTLQGYIWTSPTKPTTSCISFDVINGNQNQLAAYFAKLNTATPVIFSVMEASTGKPVLDKSNAPQQISFTLNYSFSGWYALLKDNKAKSPTAYVTIEKGCQNGMDNGCTIFVSNNINYNELAFNDIAYTSAGSPDISPISSLTAGSTKLFLSMNETLNFQPGTLSGFNKVKWLYISPNTATMPNQTLPSNYRDYIGNGLEGMQMLSMSGGKISALPPQFLAGGLPSATLYISFINSGLSSIPGSFFQDCGNLEYIGIWANSLVLDNPQSVPNNLFANCTKLSVLGILQQQTTQTVEQLFGATDIAIPIDSKSFMLNNGTVYDNIPSNSSYIAPGKGGANNRLGLPEGTVIVPTMNETYFKPRLPLP